MARTKKSLDEEKSKETANLQVSIEDFKRTRDSVVSGFAYLKNAVQELSNAYITHTNTVLGTNSISSIEPLSFANPLGAGIGASGPAFTRAATEPAPAAATEGEDGGKKKRKRAPHDKNAPKRVLTPYFLYMQTARPLIKAELGPDRKAKEVADEGTRRWASMGKDEKDLNWRLKYQHNMARYRRQVEAYKSGKPLPNITDAEAAKLYEQDKKAGIIHEIPRDDEVSGEVEDEGEGNATAKNIAETSSVTSSDDEEDEPPKKAPSPPKSPKHSKRRKIAVTKHKAEEAPSSVKKTPAKEADQVQLDAENERAQKVSKSPEKERKKASRKKKGTVEDVVEAKKDSIAEASKSSPVKEASQDGSKKEKKTRRKRQSQAAEE